jgi:hypothetical protein
MFYKAKVAVCSEIRTKHINAMWAARTIWSYVKLPLGLKSYMTIKFVDRACYVFYMIFKPIPVAVPSQM